MQERLQQIRKEQEEEVQKNADARLDALKEKEEGKGKRSPGRKKKALTTEEQEQKKKAAKEKAKRRYHDKKEAKEKTRLRRQAICPYVRNEEKSDSESNVGAAATASCVAERAIAPYVAGAGGNSDWGSESDTDSF